MRVRAMAGLRSRKVLIGLLLAALLGLAAAGFVQNRAGGAATAKASGPKTSLALFGTIPIYWGETGGVEDMLSGEAEPHWSRPVLEQRFELSPIDALDQSSLGEFTQALMAQPRALSPQENVALDEWVRAGGRLLLFADPMLTGHSHFGLGDKRRPQDVTLLSPILARWGLELEFDTQQPSGFRLVAGLGEGLPVNLPGRFTLKEEGDGPQNRCELLADRHIADCSIGKGKAFIVADAAVFDEALFATPLTDLTTAAFDAN